MERTYKISDVVRNNFLRVPLSLFANPNYRILSPEGKLTYALLLDRMSLSQKNGWLNSEGEVYLIYTREEVAETLNISYKKSIAAFRELIAAGLLFELRQGRGYPNLLFVLKEQLDDGDASEFSDAFDKTETPDDNEKEPANPHDEQICQNGTSRTAETEYLDSADNAENSGEDSKSFENEDEKHLLSNNQAYELPKTHIKNCDFGISRTSKMEYQELPESHPIQTYNNYINNNHTECNQSINQSENERLTDILERCDLDIFENDTRLMFTDAITRLYYSTEFKLGHAVLPQQQVRSVLDRLQADNLIAVLETMRNNAANIKNPTGYLMALIINSVSEEKPDLILSLPPDYLGEDDFYASE